MNSLIYSSPMSPVRFLKCASMGCLVSYATRSLRTTSKPTFEPLGVLAASVREHAGLVHHAAPAGVLLA